MQVMTRQEVQKLLSETSHALELQDIALIVELDGYADAVVNGGVSGDAVSFYAYPIVCGGVAFHPPTIGKEIYWREQIVDGVPDDWQGAAYLWLLAQPQVPSERGRDIVKAVKKWGRTCAMTSEDVARVQEKYSAGYAESGSGNTTERDYGSVIAMLVREFGQTPSHWLDAPDHEVKTMLDDYVKRQEQKASAYRSSKAGRKNPLPPAPSPKIKALREFRLCKERIKAAWLKSE